MLSSLTVQEQNGSDGPAQVYTKRCSHGKLSQIIFTSKSAQRIECGTVESLTAVLLEGLGINVERRLHLT